MTKLLDLGARSEYAIAALVRLAQRGEGAIVTVKELAEETGISQHFLYNIFDDLAKAGIVRSFRGAKRGFMLCRPPEEISFYDIVAAVEGMIEKPHCLLDRNRVCSASDPCAAHFFWIGLRDYAEQSMRELTLAQIAKKAPFGK
ncbi:MAG: Rrf2 family transcriptional regulator [Fimbriimonadales bacterium]|nr:MAG: Rrf2 family transcriptional regulator [Fimbriimonadales bacterium]